MSNETYTQWYIKFPWHVSGDKCYQYPKDDKGNCACTCKSCLKHEHKATREAHMR
jgi:hypothetical protein